MRKQLSHIISKYKKEAIQKNEDSVWKLQTKLVQTPNDNKTRNRNPIERYADDIVCTVKASLKNLL